MNDPIRSFFTDFRLALPLLASLLLCLAPVAGATEIPTTIALEEELDMTYRLDASLGEVRPFERRRNDLESLIAKGFRAVKLRVHAATLEEDTGFYGA